MTSHGWLWSESTIGRRLQERVLFPQTTMLLLLGHSAERLA
jgi:hypothetical protein